MAQNLKTLTIDSGLLGLLKKQRFRKGGRHDAVTMKMDVEAMKIVLDKKLEDCTVDEVRESLPKHQPRYVSLSYTHTHPDGRTAYPLLFIFISPAGCQPELQMMYAGSKNSLIDQGGSTKDCELENLEELTEEWVLGKLKTFG